MAFVKRPLIRSLRERWLQLLFTLALAWTLFWFGVLHPLPIEAFNPVPEGHWLHRVIEAIFYPIIAFALASMVIIPVIRFWPGFLHVPMDTPLSRILIALVVATPTTSVTLLSILIAIGLAVDPPPWNGANLQYIPAVFYLAPLGTLLIAPAAIIGTAWWWSIARRRKLDRT